MRHEIVRALVTFSLKAKTPITNSSCSYSRYNCITLMVCLGIITNKLRLVEITLFVVLCKKLDVYIYGVYEG